MSEILTCIGFNPPQSSLIQVVCGTIKQALKGVRRGEREGVQYGGREESGGMMVGGASGWWRAVWHDKGEGTRG
jgi:hypothetical protein